MSDPHQLSNFIWQIADLLRGPYRPPQYERVMLPLTVLRRFDCVLESTKQKVLAEHGKRKDKLQGEALDRVLNGVAGQRFHNHSALDFEKLKADPQNISQHLVNYIQGFSKNVRDIFDRFEFTAEIEKMGEANILYLVVSKFCDVDLHPDVIDNIGMGSLFEELIRRFNESANETAGDHFTPREVVQLMVDILFAPDDDILTTPHKIFRLLDPACGTGGYLIEHSAGSGKSNTIGWLAHRLSSLHNDRDERVFDSVIVITDRRVLDQQLQDTIYQFDHKHGVVQKIDEDSRQLAQALESAVPIIITTLQKFPFVSRQLLNMSAERRNQGKDFLPTRPIAVIVDEAHSSQSGEAASELRGVLGGNDLLEGAQQNAREEGMEHLEELFRNMAKRQHPTNLSFFAFTATPKHKTLKIFGRNGEAFHRYTMRQATVCVKSGETTW